MRTLRKRIKPTATMLLIALVSIGALAWATQSGNATGPHRLAAFGMFGVTANQTARLNVANLCPGLSATPVGPCGTRILRLSFIDANGSSGGGGCVDCVPMQTTVTLEPGHSAFFDVQGALLTSSRVQIRALVEELGSPNGVPPNPTIPSLEVIDATTEETVFHVPAYEGGNRCGGSNPFF